MRMPWGIIVLLIWFLWSLSRSVMSLFSAADSVDRAVLFSSGFEAMFFLMVVGSILLESLTAFFLIKPARIGFLVGVSAVIWSVVWSTVITLLMLADPENVKSAYIASRQARGLSVRPELYDALFSPAGMFAVLAFVKLLNIGVLILLFSNRKYFQKIK